MLISILIIYCILSCISIFFKIKNNDIIIYNYGQFIIQIITIIGFLLLFVVMLRLLKIFQEIYTIDLNKINFNLNYILGIILIYNLRNLAFLYFKISWFRFHYVMMCEINFGEKINKLYKKVYYTVIYLPAYYSYKYTIYLNYILTLLLFFFFIYDFFFNNLILYYSLWYLKYYGSFKIIYLGHDFMLTKQNLILDYYSYNMLYSGVIEHNIFINFIDKQHKDLIKESKNYVSGVIFEKFKYIPPNLGDIKDMAFFRVNGLL